MIYQITEVELLKIVQDIQNQLSILYERKYRFDPELERQLCEHTLGNLSAIYDYLNKFHPQGIPILQYYFTPTMKFELMLLLCLSKSYNIVLFTKFGFLDIITNFIKPFYDPNDGVRLQYLQVLYEFSNQKMLLGLRECFEHDDIAAASRIFIGNLYHLPYMDLQHSDYMIACFGVDFDKFVDLRILIYNRVLTALNALIQYVGCPIQSMTKLEHTINTILSQCMYDGLINEKIYYEIMVGIFSEDFYVRILEGYPYFISNLNEIMIDLLNYIEPILSNPMRMVLITQTKFELSKHINE